MRINALGNTATDFASDDYIALDGTTNGSRKMSKDDLLERTAQNALADNVAPEFVPNSTNAVANMPYIYGGMLYISKEDYNGVWNPSKFLSTNIASMLNHSDAFSRQSLELTYDKLNASFTIDNPTNIVVPSVRKNFIIPAHTSRTISIPSGYNVYAIVYDNDYKIIPLANVDGQYVILAVFVRNYNDTNSITITFCCMSYLFNGVSSTPVNPRHFLFSKGGLAINTADKTITATENIVCVMNKDGNEYHVTIPKNTSVSYATATGYVAFTLYYDIDNSSFIVKQSYYMLDCRNLLYIASLHTNGNAGIIHVSSDVNVNYIHAAGFDESEKTMSIAAVTSNGWVELDLVNGKIKIVKDLIFIANNRWVLLNNGTEYSFIPITTSSLQYLCYDFSSNSLVVKYFGNFLPSTCLATFSTNCGIIKSALPVYLNGTGSKLPVKGMYIGDPIKLTRTYNYYNMFTLSGIIYHQSLALYGDYAVAADYNSSTAKIQIYKFSTNSVVASINLQSNDSFIPHCNVICFGKNINSANSIVPLLYVSKWDYQSDKSCLVYDITETGGVYSANLVQTITPNISSSILGEGDVDWIVDTDKNMLYALAYKLAGSSLQVEGNEEKIVSFVLPNVSSSQVTLTDDDVVDSFSLPIINASQDKTYANGKIYVIAGMGASYPQFSKLVVIDLLNKRVSSEVKLPSSMAEPEGLSERDGHLYFDFGNNGLNIFVFD
jgi:hypothetical protein